MTDTIQSPIGTVGDQPATDEQIVRWERRWKRGEIEPSSPTIPALIARIRADTKKLIAAEARAMQLMQALRFYAEGWPLGVAWDEGECARIALSASDAQTTQTENSLMTAARLSRLKGETK